MMNQEKSVGVQRTMRQIMTEPESMDSKGKEQNGTIRWKNNNYRS